MAFVPWHVAIFTAIHSTVPALDLRTGWPANSVLHLYPVFDDADAVADTSISPNPLDLTYTLKTILARLISHLCI